MNNPYQTLGLPDGADSEAVVAAYRKALQRFIQHQQAGTPLPKAQFEALETAWAMLRDPAQKAAYDGQHVAASAAPVLPAASAVPATSAIPAAFATPSAFAEADVSAQPVPRVVSAASAAPAAPATLTAGVASPALSPDAAPLRFDLPSVTKPVAKSTAFPDEKEERETQDADTLREYRFRFTGSGEEYFRIWIVNLLLTIVTLSLYRPWAKVRREQYFHRNILLDGSGFDYHGQPKAILKGQLIAYGLFGLLPFLNKFMTVNPALSALVSLVGYLLLPWLITRSFAFRARNTSFRGLHFNFLGSSRRAFTIFIGYGLFFFFGAMLAGALTGLAMVSDEVLAIIPAIFLWIALFVVVFARFWKALKEFQLNHISFGGCQLETKFGSLQKIVLIAVLIAVAVMIAASMVISALTSGTSVDENPFMDLLIYLPFLSLLIFAQPYFLARTANEIWNNARLGQNFYFQCDQTYRNLMRITAVNWACIIVTFGLYWPWAKVRLMRYRTEHLALIADEDDLDGFISDQVESEQHAVGEEVADFLDFDISL